MTKDKQIIIDGIDVSGCNFTLERDGKIKCECCHATGFGVICDCESWKTCDYKNYKRKEKECEEWKETLNECCLHGLTLMTEKRVLLQTLTEIKEIVFPKNQLIITDSPIILKIQEKISEVRNELTK